MALTNKQLAAENAALRTECDSLRQQLLNVTSVASALNSKGMTPEFKAMVEQRRKDMADAKAAAIALRVCIKV